MATRLKWFLGAVLAGVCVGLFLAKKLRGRRRTTEEIG